jgi:hypothetical protein
MPRKLTSWCVEAQLTRHRIEIETTFECFEPGAVVTISWTYGDAEIEFVLNPALMSVVKTVRPCDSTRKPSLLERAGR